MATYFNPYDSYFRQQALATATPQDDPLAAWRASLPPPSQYENEDDSEFSKGVALAAASLEKDTYGAGKALTDLAGWQGGSNWFERQRAAKAQEMQRLAPLEVPSYDQVKDLSSAWKYGSGVLGTLVPSGLTMLAGGGIGGMAARGLGMAANAGRGLRAAYAASETPALVGQAAGAYLTSAAPQAGAIYEENPDAPGMSLLGGAAAGALDVYPYMRAMKTLGKTVTGKAVGGFGSELLKQTAAEAGTEGLQEVIAKTVSQLNQPEYDMWSEEAKRDYINSMIAGAIGGGVIGGGLDVLGRVMPKAQEEPPPAPTPQPEPTATPTEPPAASQDMYLPEDESNLNYLRAMRTQIDRRLEETEKELTTWAPAPGQRAIRSESLEQRPDLIPLFERRADLQGKREDLTNRIDELIATSQEGWGAPGGSVTNTRLAESAYEGRGADEGSSEGPQTTIPTRPTAYAKEADFTGTRPYKANAAVQNELQTALQQAGLTSQDYLRQTVGEKVNTIAELTDPALTPSGNERRLVNEFNKQTEDPKNAELRKQYEEYEVAKAAFDKEVEARFPTTAEQSPSGGRTVTSRVVDGKTVWEVADVAPPGAEPAQALSEEKAAFILENAPKPPTQAAPVASQLSSEDWNKMPKERRKDLIGRATKFFKERDAAQGIRKSPLSAEVAQIDRAVREKFGIAPEQPIYPSSVTRAEQLSKADETRVFSHESRLEVLDRDLRAQGMNPKSPDYKVRVINDWAVNTRGTEVSIDELIGMTPAQREELFQKAKTSLDTEFAMPVGYPREVGGDLEAQTFTFTHDELFKPKNSTYGDSIVVSKRKYLEERLFNKRIIILKDVAGKPIYLDLVRLNEVMMNKTRNVYPDLSLAQRIERNIALGLSALTRSEAVRLDRNEVAKAVYQKGSSRFFASKQTGEALPSAATFESQIPPDAAVYVSGFRARPQIAEVEPRKQITRDMVRKEADNVFLVSQRQADLGNEPNVVVIPTNFRDSDFADPAIKGAMDRAFQQVVKELEKNKKLVIPEFGPALARLAQTQPRTASYFERSFAKLEERAAQQRERAPLGSYQELYWGDILGATTSIRNLDALIDRLFARAESTAKVGAFLRGVESVEDPKAARAELETWERKLKALRKIEADAIDRKAKIDMAVATQQEAQMAAMRSGQPIERTFLQALTTRLQEQQNAALTARTASAKVKEVYENPTYQKARTDVDKLEPPAGLRFLAGAEYYSKEALAARAQYYEQYAKLLAREAGRRTDLVAETRKARINEQSVPQAKYAFWDSWERTAKQGEGLEYGQERSTFGDSEIDETFVKPEDTDFLPLEWAEYLDKLEAEYESMKPDENVAWDFIRAGFPENRFELRQPDVRKGKERYLSVTAAKRMIERIREGLVDLPRNFISDESVEIRYTGFPEYGRLSTMHSELQRALRHLAARDPAYFKQVYKGWQRVGEIGKHIERLVESPTFEKRWEEEYDRREAQNLAYKRVQSSVVTKAARNLPSPLPGTPKPVSERRVTVFAQLRDQTAAAVTEINAQLAELASKKGQPVSEKAQEYIQSFAKKYSDAPRVKSFSMTEFAEQHLSDLKRFLEGQLVKIDHVIAQLSESTQQQAPQDMAIDTPRVPWHAAEAKANDLQKLYNSKADMFGRLSTLAQRIAKLTGLPEVKIMTPHELKQHYKDRARFSTDNEAVLTEFAGKLSLTDDQRGTFGSHFGVFTRDNVLHIWISPAIKDPTMMVSALAHEMGHAIKEKYWNDANPDVKDQVLRAYEDWVANINEDTTVSEWVKSHAPSMHDTLMRNSPDTLDKTLKEAHRKMDYFTSFDEWFANQVSRWFTEQEAPQSVVDKFFKGIADAFKALYAAIRGNGYSTPSSIDDFMRDVMRGTQEGSELLRETQEAQVVSQEQEEELPRYLGSGFELKEYYSDEEIARAKKELERIRDEIASGMPNVSAVMKQIVGLQIVLHSRKTDKELKALRKKHAARASRYLNLAAEYERGQGQSGETRALKLREIVMGPMMQEQQAINELLAMRKQSSPPPGQTPPPPPGQTPPPPPGQPSKWGPYIEAAVKQAAEYIRNAHTLLRGMTTNDAMTILRGASVDPMASTTEWEAMQLGKMMKTFFMGPKIPGDDTKRPRTSPEWNMLVRASQSQGIVGQLYKFVTDESARKRLADIDGTFAVGVMYMLQQKGLLNVGPETLRKFNVFNGKAQEVWHKISGIIPENKQLQTVMEELTTERILNAPIGQQGLLWNLPTNSRDTLAKNSIQLAKRYTNWAQENIWNPIMAPGAQRLLNSKNAIIRNVGMRMFNPSHRKNMQTSFLENIRLTWARYNKTLSALLEPYEHNEEVLLDLGRVARNRELMSQVQPEAAQLFKDIQSQILDPLFEDMYAQGLVSEANRRQDYWPWLMLPEKLLKQETEFRAFMADPRFEKSWIDLIQTYNTKRVRLLFKQWQGEGRRKDEFVKGLKLDIPAWHAALMVDAKAEVAATPTTPEMIRDLAFQHLTNTMGIEYITDEKEAAHNPKVGFINTRELNFLYAKADAAGKQFLADFMEPNALHTLGEYMRTAIKRTEFAKIFGAWGEMQDKRNYAKRVHTWDKSQIGIAERQGLAAAMDNFEDMMMEARNTGASEEDITMMKGFVNAMLGMGGVETKKTLDALIARSPLPKSWKKALQSGVVINPKLQNAIGWTMVYQNFRLLPLAALSSLVDPMGIGVRSGSMSQAIAGMYDGVRAIYDEAKGNPNMLLSLSHLVGTIDRHLIADSVMEQFTGSTTYFSQKQLKLNEALFKYNLMEKLTRLSRLSATSAALAFLKFHTMTPNQNSARFMEELTILPGDVQFDANGDVKVLSEAERKANPADVPRDDRVRTAILRFVEHSIVRPDPGQRPFWMSDPHFGLLGQYRGFTFSFYERILKRAASELTEHGEVAPLLSLLWYVPVMMFADALRDFIQHGSDGAPWKRSWSVWDHVTYGAKRAGFLGHYENLLSATEYPSSVLGPTGSQLIDWPQSRPNLQQDILNATPFSVLHKNWFKRGKEYGELDQGGHKETWGAPQGSWGTGG